MGSIGLPELLIVFAVVVLILGPKRIPRTGRAVGNGIKEFKDSITGGKKAEDNGLPRADAGEETLDGEVVRDDQQR